MDGFTYSDIFATKGAEYLIVIAFLGILIPFVLLMKRSGTARARLSGRSGPFAFSVADVPAGYLICRNHTWMYLEKQGAARIGFDPFLTGMCGSGQIRHVKTPGETVLRGEAIVEIATNGKLLTLQSPVTGKFLGMNPQLRPGRADTVPDPLGESWIYRVRPSQWLDETLYCNMGNEARSWYREETVRLRDELALKPFSTTHKGVPVILQDGGEVDLSHLSSLPESDWNHLKREFFSL